MKILRVGSIVQGPIVKTSSVICPKVHRDLLLFLRKMKICPRWSEIRGKVRRVKFYRKKLTQKSRVDSFQSWNKNISKWRKNWTKLSLKPQSTNFKMICYKKTAQCLDNKSKTSNSNWEKLKLNAVTISANLKVSSKNWSIQSKECAKQCTKTK